jgi:predicted RNA-binding protein YlqC (UPF0109 family)
LDEIDTFTDDFLNKTPTEIVSREDLITVEFEAQKLLKQPDELRVNNQKKLTFTQS